MKQGDPLAHFLFLMVTKGFSGMIYMVVDLHLLSRIIVGSSNLLVSHLQYVDDTIILVDATIDNLWTTMDIIYGFELAYGLRVNIAKSSIIRVNSD